MKYLLTLLSMLCLSTDLFAGTIPIYDSATIETKSYYSEAVGDTISKTIKYSGEAKSDSKNTGRAKAKVVAPDKDIINNIVSWINNNKTGNYSNQAMESNLAKIVDLKSITDPSMARVTAATGGNDIIVLNGTFNGLIKSDAKEVAIKSDEPKNIVWIGRYTDKVEETIYCDLSISSIYDSTRTINIDGITDIDGDGNYEIIINDLRYAGRFYQVIHFTSSHHLIKVIHGDSWD